MQDKNSFVLYTEYRQHLDLLTDEECGRLFKAIMEYSATGVAPSLDGAERMAFSFIQAQLERDNQKYAETRKKRSEAGKMGGRPQKAKKANAFSEKQDEANKAVDVDVDVDVDVKDLSPLTPQGEEADTGGEASSQTDDVSFADFWEAYPRKSRKGAAEEAWKSMRIPPEVARTIVSVVGRAINSEEWRKEKGRFIPAPEKFLIEKRWEDDYTPAKHDLMLEMGIYNPLNPKEQH